MVDSVDRAIQAEIQQIGLELFVARDFQFLKDDHDMEPNWWRLAYDEGGELVGFVQGVRFPNTREGNLASLGIVPVQRGNGYGLDLLKTGTALLLQAGIENIVARTDSKNIAMQRTFEKAGYELGTRIRTYQYVL